mmetsp:Transcript_4641/g.21082  ORF Transcript_4641/g.21082 Transcript_4641/m.21082 type:complete len:206 (-) Transcript_4641:66-683(-)
MSTQMPLMRPAGTSGYRFLSTYCHLFFADCFDLPVAAAMESQLTLLSRCTRIRMMSSSSSGLHRTLSLPPSLPIIGESIMESSPGNLTGVPMAKATDGVEGVGIVGLFFIPSAVYGVPASAATVAHSSLTPPSSVPRPPISVSSTSNPKLAAAAAKASWASGNMASGPSGQKCRSCQMGWSFGYVERFTRSTAACSICASARLSP